PVGLGERISVFGHVWVGQNAAVSLQPLVRLLVPNLTRRACREVGLLHTGGFLLHRTGTACPASGAGSAVIVAPCRLGRGRSESQSDGDNSTEENGCETRTAFVSG